MAKFLFGSEIAAEVESLMQSGEEVACAVAFWGQGALESVIEAAATRVETRIVCNLDMGGTNPRIVNKLRGHLAVRHDPRLHAKVYLAPGIAIVGSANASANGMGLEGDELRGWSEAAVRLDEHAEVQEVWSWFKGVWQKASVVKDEDVARAQAGWGRRRTSRPRQNVGRSLLGVVRDNPEELEDRLVFAPFRGERMEPDEEREVNKAGEELGIEVTGYSNWPAVTELPEGAEIVELVYGARGALRSIFRSVVVEDKPRRVARDRTVKVVRKVHAVPNPLSKSDREWLTRNQEVWRAAYPHSEGFEYNDDQSPGIIYVKEMAELLNS